MTSAPLRAALWMIGAILSFTLMAVAGRAVSLELDTFEIMLFRSLVGLTIVLVIAGVTGRLGEVTLNRAGLHLVRNMAHFTGQNLWFYAITVAHLAQVFALEFTGPVWVVFLAPIFLGEKLRKMAVVSAILGFIGVLFVAQPQTGGLGPGLLPAGIAAIAFAFTAIFTRKLTRTESITCIMVWLTGSQAVFGLIMAGYDGDIAVPTGAALPWVMAIACAGLMAHFCLTKALSIAPANIVMPIDFARLPLVAGIGALAYGEPLELSILLGGGIILFANWLNLRPARA